MLLAFDRLIAAAMGANARATRPPAQVQYLWPAPKRTFVYDRAGCEGCDLLRRPLANSE
jgi:hypothetical protein